VLSIIFFKDRKVYRVKAKIKIYLSKFTFRRFPADER